jgi:MFS family permease
MLGLVSLCMDTSSEMIHSLLPVLLVSVLGVGASIVGLIEGLAEATVALTKAFSGTLSDRLRRRKLLTVVGYALGAISKPLFPLASSAGWILCARVLDRIGKGIRGAPRDALVSDITPAHLRGASFGLRQALDTVGAFLGPLLAIFLMTAVGVGVRDVFWLATIPAALAVVVLLVGVHEPARAGTTGLRREPLRRADVRALGPAYWSLVIVASVLTLARFSEAFLVLRAREAGLSVALTPMTLVVMNVVYAASAYPMGAVSDRCGRGFVLAIGFSVLIAADLVLAATSTILAALIGIGLWGLHMGMTQGLLAALVADSTPGDRRGTAFGFFHLTTGVATLLASVLAGYLWQHYGSGTTFVAGALLTGAGLLVALPLVYHPHPRA